MRSRWPSVVVLCALAVLCLVVAWTTKAPTRRGGPPFDAARGRAAIAQFFAQVRGRGLPKFDYDAMLVPLGLPFGSDEQRWAWESYLATIEPRLRALDELHDDPDVQAILLTGDGAPVLEPVMKMREWFCLRSELVNSAEIALERGDVDTAMKRVAQAFEIVLTDRDHDWQRTFPACSTWGVDTQGLESLRRHPRWEPQRAFDTIAPRLRALLEDRERYLDGGRALERRFEGTMLGLHHEDQSVEGVLRVIEGVESIVEQSVARQRVLLLALAADAFRAEHGRWPTSTSELVPSISPDELLTPLTPEPLDVRHDGSDLCVGLVHSKRPAHERGTTLTLTR